MCRYHLCTHMFPHTSSTLRSRHPPFAYSCRNRTQSVLRIADPTSLAYCNISCVAQSRVLSAVAKAPAWSRMRHSVYSTCSMRYLDAFSVIFCRVSAMLALRLQRISHIHGYLGLVASWSGIRYIHRPSAWTIPWKTHPRRHVARKSRQMLRILYAV